MPNAGLTPLVLHAHWRPADSAPLGHLHVWAEAAGPGMPERARGRPRVIAHPFALPAADLAAALDAAGVGVGIGVEVGADEDAAPGAVALRLPATGNLPLPSPRVVHGWDELADAPVSGLRTVAVLTLAVKPLAALEWLDGFPTGSDLPPHVAAGDDLRFWVRAARLAVALLAGERFVPDLVPGTDGGYRARWQASFHRPEDAARRRRLVEAMPPIARAGAGAGGGGGSGSGSEGGDRSRVGAGGRTGTGTRAGAADQPTGRPSDAANAAEIGEAPDRLLDDFLAAVVDAAVRGWAGRGPTQVRADDGPAAAWLRALLADDPDTPVEGPAFSLATLAAGHRAWLTQLHAAGDAAFRVCFQLDVPPEADERWPLAFHLQATDDPSLLIPAARVWAARDGAIEVVGRRFEDPQERLLTGLGHAARVFEPVARGLDRP